MIEQQCNVTYSKYNPLPVTYFFGDVCTKYAFEQIEKVKL